MTAARIAMPLLLVLSAGARHAIPRRAIATVEIAAAAQLSGSQPLPPVALPGPAGCGVSVLNTWQQAETRQVGCARPATIYTTWEQIELGDTTLATLSNTQLSSLTNGQLSTLGN